MQAWTVIDLAIYSIFVCKEICDHLRVYLFYITTTTSTAKSGSSFKMGTNSKNGSNNSSGSYQQFKYPSTFTSFIYPSKTKTK